MFLNTRSITENCRTNNLYRLVVFILSFFMRINVDAHIFSFSDVRLADESYLHKSPSRYLQYQDGIITSSLGYPSALVEEICWPIQECEQTSNTEMISTLHLRSTAFSTLSSQPSFFIGYTVIRAYVPAPFPRANGPGATKRTPSTSWTNFILSVAMIWISGTQLHVSLRIRVTSNGIKEAGYSGYMLCCWTKWRQNNTCLFTSFSWWL